MERNNLLEHIEREYPTLSKRQKAIADYILKNYDKAAFMTASALGKAAGVSESTVVRFACTMGYEGYPKLQKNLQEAIKRKLTTVQRLSLMEGLEDSEILDTVLKMDITNIRETRASIDVETFRKVADLMVRADNIYVMGYRSSTQLAQFFVYYLNYIFDNVKLVTAGASDIYAQLMHTKPDDIVIALSFPRYSTQTLDGIKFAKSHGTKIVAITDNIISPLYKLADYSLIAKTDMNSFVDSLVAPMSIINALSVMIGLAKKDQLVENFEIVEKIWEERDIYIRPDSDMQPPEAR